MHYITQQYFHALLMDEMMEKPNICYNCNTHYKLVYVNQKRCLSCKPEKNNHKYENPDHKEILMFRYKHLSVRSIKII